MGNFKDFDLDLKKVKTNNEFDSRAFTFDLDCLTSYTDLSEAMCSDPSTHCSPSDMTACRNAIEPGKAVRC